MVHFKSSSFSHIIDFTSFHHIFCWSYMNHCSLLRIILNIELNRPIMQKCLDIYWPGHRPLKEFYLIMLLFRVLCCNLPERKSNIVQLTTRTRLKHTKNGDGRRGLMAKESWQTKATITENDKSMTGIAEKFKIGGFHTTPEGHFISSVFKEGNRSLSPFGQKKSAMTLQKIGKYWIHPLWKWEHEWPDMKCTSSLWNPKFATAFDTVDPSNWIICINCLKCYFMHF